MPSINHPVTATGLGRLITAADWDQALKLTGTPDTVLSFDSLGNAVDRTISSLSTPLIESYSSVVLPEKYGAIAGDFTVDNTVALQAALNTGRLVWLDPTKTYSFGSQLAPPSGGGFIGGGTLLMLTGTGKFDRNRYNGNFTNSSGIYIFERIYVTLQCRVQMQANADIRTSSAIYVGKSTNIKLDVECWGFKEANFGIIDWNTNVGGFVRAFVHDCGTTLAVKDPAGVTSLPSIQITALAVDGGRHDGFNSSNLTFDVVANDLTMSDASVAVFGEQTDGVNLGGQANALNPNARGHQGRVTAYNVHEAIDIFSDYNIVDVVAHTCLFGAKVIHGASHNQLRVVAHNIAKDGIVIAGSANTQATHNNKIDAILTGIGSNKPGKYSSIAVNIDGSGAAFPCNGNEVNVVFEADPAGNTDAGVAINTGSDNIITFEQQGTGVIPVNALTTITGAGSGNVTRRKRLGVVRATHNATQLRNGDTTIEFNTELADRYNEFTGNVFTCKVHGWYNINFRSNQSVNGGEQFGSYIRKGASIVSRKTQTNMSAGGLGIPHSNSTDVYLVPGDTIFIRSGNTVAGMSIFGTEENLILEIRELG